jgi:hypothetical protein
MDSDSLEITYRYRVTGQKGGFHRTDVMREFPFEETREMGANPWRRIARKYRVRFVNEILEIYYQDGPEDSLSRGKRIHRPKTGMIRHAEILNCEIDWFWRWPSAFFRSAAHYGRFGFHCGVMPQDQLRNLSTPLAKTLAAMMLPVAFALYRRDPR